MFTVRVRNAHAALPAIIECVQLNGARRNSRDGEVMSIPGPTCIEYSHPQERVIFWGKRDANPFFHLAESLWMLAGRRDVEFPAQFVKSMYRFSDNGKNFHAAYGYRWRKHFGMDQIAKIILALKENKDCRRQVLSMWDPKADLEGKGVDLPCNINVTFQINPDNKLDMVVFNRSNDAILGAVGANVVHMSILQEYVSASIDLPIGKYWQISSNMHAYIRDLEKFKGLEEAAQDPYRTTQHCPYSNGSVVITPIMDADRKIWDEDLALWFKDPFKVALRSKFFLRTATPMLAAYRAYKEKNLEVALEIVNSQMDVQGDWTVASRQWLERRLQ